MSDPKTDKSGINKSDYFNDPAYRKSVQKILKFEKRLKKVLWVGIPAVTVLILFVIFSSLTNLPSLEELENPKPELASVVYSNDGEVIHRFFNTNRRLVPLSEMSPLVVNALLASEDRRFYDHWGFDLVRTIKAMGINIATMSIEQGASTITQQLSRTLFLKSAEQTYTRKIRELYTAIQIERTYTKNEILAMYLNSVYFGSGAHGVQAAAQTYFGKTAKELNILEAATLIGILPSPNRYNPVTRPGKAFDRRNIILYNMREVGYISDADYQTLIKEPVTTHFTSVTDMGLAPYFTERVRQYLQDEGDVRGFNLYNDGLSIYTSIDSKMQKIANSVVTSHLDSIQVYFDRTFKWDNDLMNILIQETTPYQNAILQKERPAEALKRFRLNKAFTDSIKNEKKNLQAAFVVLDQHNGYVKAWVGGRDFSKTKFDHVALAKRQPGSSFKPIIYSVVIDKGYPPTYEVLNQPITIEDATVPGGWWTPKNAEGEFGGMTTLRDALKESLNLITIRLVMDIAKPTDVVQYAQRMGITSKLQAVNSIALGSSEVTPLELTSAYGTFPNEGVHVEPILVLRAEDINGNLILENRAPSQEVFSKETAYILTSMLQTVINQGTGASARGRYKFYGPAGGKTGTTNEHGDAWFVGFTPDLTAGVWVGNDDRRIHFQTMEFGQGARAALPIWAKFMKQVYDRSDINIERGNFVKPPGIFEMVICRETKKTATEFCPDTYIETFTKLTAPTTSCDKHTSAESSKPEAKPVRKKIGF